jgi:hypothetical protein
MVLIVWKPKSVCNQTTETFSFNLNGSIVKSHKNSLLCLIYSIGKNNSHQNMFYHNIQDSKLDAYNSWLECMWKIMTSVHMRKFEIICCVNVNCIERMMSAIFFKKVKSWLGHIKFKKYSKFISMKLLIYPSNVNVASNRKVYLRFIFTQHHEPYWLIWDKQTNGWHWWSTSTYSPLPLGMPLS